MTNRFYAHGTSPAPRSFGSSAVLRTEFEAVETGFSAVETELDAAVVNAVSAVGIKNYFINARMLVCSGATVVHNISSSGYYGPDNWRLDMSAPGYVCRVARVFDHPILAAQGFCYAVTTTTPLASVGATDFVALMQRLEGPLAYELRNNPVTLSFWVRSPMAGTHCVALRAGTLDRSLVREYTVSSPNTWEKKTVSATIDYVASAFNFAPGLAGLDVIWPLAAGSSYRVAGDTWQNGNFFATAAQQNLCTSQDSVFAVTDLQLERGGTATQIEGRPYALDLMMVERFYEKSYAHGVAPGTAYTVGAGHQMASGSLGGNVVFSAAFRQTKAKTPTMTFYDADGTAGRLSYYDGNWASGLVPTSIAATAHGFHVMSTSPAIQLLDLQWVADARL